MTRAVVLSTLAAAVAGLAFAAAPASAQDENPTTPGAIPNPGTYQGSMELQRRSDEQDQQFRQQQSQPSYQPAYPQPRYNAPAGGYAPRRAAPPPERPRTGAQAFGKEAPGDVMAERLAARGDYAGALRLWRPLAAQGDVNAEYNLGVMYDVGHGVPVSAAQAAFWYRKAAEKGMGPAMLNLATIIVQHARGPADLVPAYTWMRIAANRDPAVRAGAMHNMSLISHAMSYDQVTRAEAAAHAWAPH